MNEFAACSLAAQKNFLKNPTLPSPSISRQAIEFLNHVSHSLFHLVVGYGVERDLLLLPNFPFIAVVNTEGDWEVGNVLRTCTFVIAETDIGCML